ncbi:hypothetical protein [uncultured Lamprocystis sp.]|jgi:hypothetical protein|uniref:DUF7694 domain-containing protein n=1 Tax=uncultured Lamprocystis sp. TaxID=543132 RepID=UPI0025DB822E|nr:hypothetical protein [uncultured Lamprocystis sp.]
MSFHVPEADRIRVGKLASSSADGNNGAFLLRVGRDGLFAIASSEGGWEHVSVSHVDRCPTWDEMAEVAALFWDPEDTVIQFRPPASDYVNCHPYCLHWWRPTHADLPRPPMWMVGPRAAAVAHG